ncbi:TPA: DUF4276 family protein, partial [Candidatus Poribacteria bacterium]|nr:DUF4276 family protein [Candidatus Poribacteria bacterium]
MNRFVIVPIVEGQSEVASVPVLLRRLLSKRQRHDVTIARPVRVHRTSVVKEGEIERAVALARRNREGCDAVLVLLDADDDCPAELGPKLLNRIKKGHGDLSAVAVVLPKREFEGWFLGSLQSLRGVRGIAAAEEIDITPQNILDAIGIELSEVGSGKAEVGS